MVPGLRIPVSTRPTGTVPIPREEREEEHSNYTVLSLSVLQKQIYGAHGKGHFAYLYVQNDDLETILNGSKLKFSQTKNPAVYNNGPKQTSNLVHVL